MWLYTPALTQRHIYLDTLLAIAKLKSNLKKKKKNRQIKPTILVWDYPFRELFSHPLNRVSCEQPQTEAVASADGVHWILVEKMMLHFPFNCLLPPALCQDLRGGILNWLKNGQEMKKNTFTLVPWLHEHVQKEGSWRGRVLVAVAAPCFPPTLQNPQGAGSTPWSSPPNPWLCPQNKKFHIPSSATVNSGLSQRGDNTEGSLETKDTHTENWKLKRGPEHV